MGKSGMHTTPANDDDVLATAKKMAATERKTRNGVPLLTVRKGARRVTPELVCQLNKELS